MGYTVYYENKNTEVFKEENRRKAFADDFKKVMEIFDINKTNITREYIKTTNKDPYFSDAKEHCHYYIEDDLTCVLTGPHEWFVSPESDFEFTKTARKSYDGLVKILYLLNVKHFGGKVSHDGDGDYYLLECKDNITTHDLLAISKSLCQVVEKN